MAGKQWISGLAGVAMLALVVASCDNADDPIAPEVARAFAQVILGASPDAQSQPDGLAAAAADIEVEEYDITLACPEGGTLRIVGTITEDREAGTWKKEETMTYDNCDIGEFTVVEGVIDHVHESVRVSELLTTWEGHWDGAALLETGDGGGECAVALTEDGTFKRDPEHRQAGDFEKVISGTVCGVPFYEHETWGLD